MLRRNVVLQVQDIALSFGGIQSLAGLSFNVLESEVLAVIGPNGAGKTATLNCITGFYHPQQGKIAFGNKQLCRLRPYQIAKIGIGRTFQNLALYVSASTVDNLLAARHLHTKENMLAQAFSFGPVIREEIRQRQVVEEIIDFLEIESIRYSIVGTLPYGLRKRVELGRALALEPKLLLLDEPMAGMNLEEKEDMARFILDIHELRKIPIILVEHDMGLVMDIAQRIVVLDFGRKIAEGSPSEIKVNPTVIKAYLGEE